jgi:hypothetical protein
MSHPFTIKPTVMSSELRERLRGEPLHLFEDETNMNVIAVKHYKGILCVYSVLVIDAGMQQRYDFISICDIIGRLSYDEERNLWKVDDVTITPPKRIPEETSAYEYPFEMPSASRKGWAIEIQGNRLQEGEMRGRR